ncbi:MBL fold metallo-hydrolase [Solibacillus isronensis]|uniref:MBL fold metallo-hydrolase n=1 Tax=Solibacillus isronensis TaxID=412383 RepID=UPI00203FD702|nr:MBL fold metallo-hydrolase [Solibacillus isronensis]MCM3723067.1 MBL fold metallo-hydrolase [Solibacillus isronensis]
MKKIMGLIMFTLLFVAGCTETAEDTYEEPLKEMAVHFIDVGQGDSIFIEAPNGKTMLIDGGVKGAGKEVVAYLKAQGVNRLDYVVATHPDADHIGGLISVLNSISIKEFIDSGKVHTSQTYEEMLNLIQAKNIKFTIPEAGDEIQLEDNLIVEVLAADESASDNNDASIVLHAEYQNISFLLMGDADHGVEQELLQKGTDVQATILKAGHHGSNTSSSPKFVEAVSPLATILSYGQDNKYGHPHAEVIDILQNVNSEIYSTAEAGTIVITTDGVTYDIDAQQWTGIGATSSIPLPASTKSGKVELVSKDVHEEIVVIQNNSNQAVNLEGWELISVEGNQVFNFPDINLAPGEKLSITSGPNAKTGAATLEWSKRQIWLNSGDAAQLVNTKGEVVSELQ